MSQHVKQLPAGLWGDRCPNPDAPVLFGLAHGQMRPMGERRFHNAVWYNAYGEQVGFGDLSERDIQRIMAEIEEGCYLLIAAENHGMQPPATRPGIQTVITHAELLLTHGQGWWLLPFPRVSIHATRGMEFGSLSYQEARDRLLPLQRKATDPEQA